jgi:hypothetical protein
MSPLPLRRVKLILLCLVLVYAVPAVALAVYKLVKPKTVSSGQILYRLNWDTTRLNRDGTAWVFMTNRGFKIRLEQGLINAYGWQLISCPHSHSWLESLLSGIAQFGMALAGHGAGRDAAELIGNQLESLVQPKNSSFAAVTVHEPNYCEGYFVMVKASLNRQNSVPSMAGKSIFLRGRYTKNGVSRSFVISSANAFGDAHKLMQGNSFVHAAISAVPIEVLFTRRLAGLLDDLDFTETDFTKGMTVLRNLNNQTRVTVLSGLVHSN